VKFIIGYRRGSAMCRLQKLV